MIEWSEIQYGDLPGWLEAIGTVGALWAVVLGLRRERAIRRAEEAARRRAVVQELITAAHFMTTNLDAFHSAYPKWWPSMRAPRAALETFIPVADRLARAVLAVVDLQDEKLSTAAWDVVEATEAVTKAYGKARASQDADRRFEVAVAAFKDVAASVDRRR